MIVVTGAAGFIGSCLVGLLNSLGHHDLLLVDNPPSEEKKANLVGKKYTLYLGREEFLTRFDQFPQNIDIVFHLGARTDTTLMDKAEFAYWNVGYSQSIWRLCARNCIPLIYASSAATYGLGEHGFVDDESLIPQLHPLNPYGDSKQMFDLWALAQDLKPPFWAGLKFFNVYGPNEYHKGRMASVVYHAYRQIKSTGGMALFRSHHPSYADGGQMRDFIYVKDVLDVMLFLKNHPHTPSGIYNLGTGHARTFMDLAKATFAAMHRKPNINFIDTPLDIRDKYQYFTEANMDKLRSIGYTKPFTTLEDGVGEYVREYLSLNAVY